MTEPLAFVDLETTGTTASVDRVTEIGIVEVDALGVREWSRLVDPHTPIPAFIQAMTGITDAMVAGQPSFGDLAEELQERLRGRLFVAHNARFDYGFLRQEFERVGRDFRATVLCTVKLSRRLYPGERKHNLDALIERHALRVSGRHRALADARLIHQFWQRLHEGEDTEALAAAVAALTAQPALPPQIDANIIDRLPEGPGVYLFFGENDVALYVGRGKDIRAGVLSHFSRAPGSAKAVALARQLRRIDWIACGSELAARLKQASLVEELQPAHNRRARLRRI